MEKEQFIRDYMARYSPQLMNGFMGDIGTRSQQEIYRDALRAWEAQSNRQQAADDAQAQQDELAGRAEDDWQEIRDLTIGARQEVMDDPYLTDALGQYRRTLEQGGPITDELVGRMLARTDAESQARARYEKRESTRQMAAQNLRPGDPGYQASLRDVYLEDMRRRQGARNDLAVRQALENQRYGDLAAQGLSGARMRQLALANQMGSQGAEYLSRRSYEDPSNPSRVSINYPSYGGYTPPEMPALPVQQQVTYHRTGTNRTPIQQAPVEPTQTNQINPAPGSALQTYAAPPVEEVDLNVDDEWI